VLTGLADGLAPKEWRYAEAIRPNSGSPASWRAAYLGRAVREFSVTGAAC